MDNGAADRQTSRLTPDSLPHVRPSKNVDGYLDVFRRAQAQFDYMLGPVA
jgi:hypothetical protein